MVCVVPRARGVGAMVLVLLLLLALPGGQSLTVPGGPKAKALLADVQGQGEHKAMANLDKVQLLAGEGDCVRTGLDLLLELFCTAGLGSPIVQVQDSCVLDADGDVFCTTSDSEDGDGYIDYRGGGAVQMIGSGGDYCAALASGDVHCWAYFDTPGYDLGVAGTLAIADTHFLGHCRLLTGGAVDCDRPAGDRPAGTVAAFAQGNPGEGTTSCFVRTDGDVECPDTPALSLAGQRARAASLDGTHLYAVTQAGNVRCVGPAGSTWSDYDQRDAVAVEVGDHARCILTKGGDALCRGTKDGHAVPSYTGGDAIGIEMDAWQDLYCVLLQGGSATCFGSGGHWSARTAPYAGLRLL